MQNDKKTTTEQVQAHPKPKKGMSLAAQIVVWLAILAILALVAVGLARTQQGTVQIGDQIPDFTLKFFDGYTYEGNTELKLSDFKGKVVVLNFWASWCIPCEDEAAELESSWRYYQNSDQVVFIGVDYVDTEPEARGYLTKFDITYPNGPDLATKISQLFRIKGVPETYFIDKEGKLAYTQIGPFSTEAQIHNIIDGLLAK